MAPTGVALVLALSWCERAANAPQEGPQEPPDHVGPSRGTRLPAPNHRLAAAQASEYYLGANKTTVHCARTTRARSRRGQRAPWAGVGGRWPLKRAAEMSQSTPAPPPHLHSHPPYEGGYFWNKLKPKLTVDSGDVVTVEMVGAPLRSALGGVGRFQ